MKKFLYGLNLVIIIALIYLLSKVSYESNELKSEISSIKKKIEKDRDDIRILKAEWAYLSSPERIKKLSQKYLDLKLQSPNQFRKRDEVVASND